jgi:hypothetical protein
MKTQYLIGGRYSGGTSELYEATHSHIPFQRQQPGALDQVPGYLDLPSGTLRSEDVRRYLNVSALFNEHLIVPDGWLHCSGPLSEYLRVQFRKAQSWPGQHHGPRFAADPLLQYLHKGIVVPALRGDRPSKLGDDPVGFDLFKVWNGECKDLHGAHRGFGVAFLSDSERMVILDQNDAENKAVVAELANATTLFVDWTSPTALISEVGFDSDADRDTWDREFTGAVESAVLDAPLAALGLEAVTRLLELGAPPLDAIPLVKQVDDFWTAVLDSVESDAKSGKFRRGSIERAVAAQFGLKRFCSYEALNSGSLEKQSIPHPLREMYPTRDTLKLRTLLARTLLDRVSTVQQAMFARKFNAEFGFPRRPTPDVYDRKLLAMSGHQTDVERFIPFAESIWSDEIPFENLTAEQVITLRGKHSEFFDAMREAEPAADFWRHNEELLELTRNYVRDIAAAIPMSAAERVVVTTARTTVVGGVVARASEAVAGISLGQGFGLWWFAKRTMPPLSRWLTRALDDRIEQEVIRWRSRGYADLMFGALEIHTECPDVARFLHSD